MKYISVVYQEKIPDTLLIYIWLNAYLKCTVRPTVIVQSDFFKFNIFPGEQGGQTIKLSPLHPIWPRNCLVALAECDGALSSINTNFLRRPKSCSSDQGRSTSSKRAQYEIEVILTPYRTWKGLVSSLSMMPAHTIAPPPRYLVGAESVGVVLCPPSQTLPLHQPSGPSRVDRVSSVNITYFISSFMYVVAYSCLIWTCLGVNGCFISGDLTVAMVWSTRLRVIFLDICYDTVGKYAFTGISRILETLAFDVSQFSCRLNLPYAFIIPTLSGWRILPESLLF